MEIFPCNNMIYNYFGKRPIESKDGVSNHLLIYHCLDVAAVGQVLLQNDDNLLDRMRRNTGLDKEKSLSLITFFLTMHDLGKFSEGVKNGIGNIIGIHHIIGLNLWPQIWQEIWQENLLGLDKSFNDNESNWKDLFEPWFHSVMDHHKDFNNHPTDNRTIYFTEENIATAGCFVRESAKLLLDINSVMPSIKIRDGMHVSFKNISKWLKELTVWSDWIGSNIDNFQYCTITKSSPTESIKNYWDNIALPTIESYGNRFPYR
ncbi:CRISPR-associated endonuclease/helicase Cas3 [Methanosarcinales archaeon]|nr:CRISPR-associated endonuclease/helicase Cas3 [Methanosarcinales archaeon]